MPRVGTLLGTCGRPEDQVQIIRKGQTTTRIKRSVNYGRSWATEEEQVDTALILGSFAEFERSNIRERQAEGVTLAKRLPSTQSANALCPRRGSKKRNNEQWQGNQR